MQESAHLPREITLQQETTAHLPLEITLQQEAAPQSIRLEQIEHDSYQTTYVYGSQLFEYDKGWDVTENMLNIAKNDLAPITWRSRWQRPVYGNKVEILVRNNDSSPSPIPTRKYAILMSVFAQCEYWHEAVLERERQLMENPTTEPTVKINWQNNVLQKYLAETKNYRPTNTKRASLFRRKPA